MVGPTYRKTTTGEWLTYYCATCGYVKREECVDAKYEEPR
jgi:hypothetical protein